MTIVWAGKCSMSSGTFDLVLSAIFEDERVLVTLTHQAFTLHGLDACKRMAETKIVKFTQKGQPLEEVEVSEADFSK